MNEYQNKLYLAKNCKVPEVDVEKVVEKRFGFNKEKVTAQLKDNGEECNDISQLIGDEEN